MSDYKQQAKDIFGQIFDGLDYIDGNVPTFDEMQAYIAAGLQAAHDAGAAAERGTVRGMLTAAQIAHEAWSDTYKTLAFLLDQLDKVQP